MRRQNGLPCRLSVRPCNSVQTSQGAARVSVPPLFVFERGTLAKRGTRAANVATAYILEPLEAGPPNAPAPASWLYGRFARPLFPLWRCRISTGIRFFHLPQIPENAAHVPQK